jgi:LacI family transcriptional regulator
MIETSRAYGRDILVGVRRYIAENEPWSVFMEIRDLESSPPGWLEHWDGDGILARTGNRSVAAAVRGCRVPVVELRSVRLNPDTPFVGIDNKAVGKICAEYFLVRGHTSFGLYELATEQFFAERRHSFVKTLRSHGFECHTLQQSGKREKPSQWERQQMHVVEWLRTLPKPIAILACTDQLGYWLLDACNRAGLKVPDEVAVMGVENDDSLCTMSRPTLTSLALGGERVGYAAAEILSRMMSGKKPPARQRLLHPLNIVERGSTDVIAVSDPLIAAALRMIREHATDGIGVYDILRAIPISRSSLERGFRAVLKRSPNEEINRVKLEQAKSLLLQSELSLNEISNRTGFTSVNYFSYSFAKHFGMTAGTYRKSGS